MNIEILRAKEILDNVVSKHIAVIGDVMLDKYYWGSVNRISPEAPVPVIDVINETAHLGGAANVASNLKSLGVNTFLCGIIGNDKTGEDFLKIAKDSELNSNGLFIDVHRPTTCKTRIIGNNQQIARLDFEDKSSITNEGSKHILEFLNGLSKLDAIILEDYNKGVLSKRLIADIIKFANNNKIKIFVDPKFDNFFEYQTVTLFKPNKKEASKALNFPINSLDDARIAGKKLLTKLNCENVMLTLGADGMMIFEKNGDITSIPTRAIHIADVSGAGDTAIATLCASLSTNSTIKEAAILSNIAAGIVCEEPGIISIKPEAILNSFSK